MYEWRGLSTRGESNNKYPLPHCKSLEERRFNLINALARGSFVGTNRRCLPRIIPADRKKPHQCLSGGVDRSQHMRNAANQSLAVYAQCMEGQVTEFTNFRIFVFSISVCHWLEIDHLPFRAVAISLYLNSNRFLDTS